MSEENTIAGRLDALEGLLGELGRMLDRRFSSVDGAIARLASRLDEMGEAIDDTESFYLDEDPLGDAFLKSCEEAGDDDDE